MNTNNDLLTLSDMEGLLRRISSDLWVMTVDNPDTATPASEAAGMTPRRRQLREVQHTVDSAVDAVEALINDTREEV